MGSDDKCCSVMLSNASVGSGVGASVGSLCIAVDVVNRLERVQNACIWANPRDANSDASNGFRSALESIIVALAALSAEDMTGMLML